MKSGNIITSKSNNFKQLCNCLIAIILLTGLSVSAQTEFLSDFQQQQSYYDSLISVLGADSMQGTGYTQFKRWYRYWAPKLSSNYDYDDYQADLLDYSNSYNYTQNGNSTPTWRLIGPNDIPDLGGIAKGTGQIHYIYKDLYSENTLYACSPVGGLFRSEDDGNNWVNAGTDKGLPRPGVSSIVIDHKIVNLTSETTLYLSTGNGEGFDGDKAWQTAIGVWRSSDFGLTWSTIGLDSSSQNNYIYHMRKIIKIANNTDSTHLIVTTTEGLYETRNANKETPTWTELIPGEFYDVVQDLNSDNIIYASGSNNTGIYSYNLNNSVSTKIFDVDTITLPYDTMEITRPELRRISLKISKADSNYLFAVFSMRDYNYTAIYRYDIYNQIWHKFYANSSFNGYARKLGWAIRPKKNSNGQIHILGQDAFLPLWLIYNGLSSDTISLKKEIIPADNVVPHVDMHYLLIEDNDSTIWAGTDGGIYKGEFINDTTVSWVAKSRGLGVATIEHLDASSNGNLVTSGQFDCGSNTYTSSNEIDWYIWERTLGDGFQNVVVSDENYFVSAQNGVIREYYQGNNFDSRFMGTYAEECNQSEDTIPIANFSTYYVRLQDNLYGVSKKEVMKYPTIDGKWEKWSNFTEQIGCAISGTWRVAAKDANGTHQIYASARQENPYYHYLYKSIDGGGQDTTKWAKIDNTPSEGFISAIEITDNTDSVLVAIGDSLFCVNTTNPSIPVWYDVTFDLDAGNINSIHRNNNKTWLGAEHGVFYLDEGSNIWVNYTTNLPNCEVKDIKAINNRIYAGTYGRGVWFASAPSCNNSGEPYTISSNTNVIHSGIYKKYFRDVIVPSGLTYTIYGTLSMGAGCKIIVERGAKLLVDGGTITKGCPDFWNGIELWGNSNAVQDTINQGLVVLRNGATIEYAKQAIATIKNIDSTGISDLNFAGGLIWADSSYFLNNTSSVQMFPYPHAYGDFPLEDNKSYFKNCTFTYDSAYYYLDDDPLQHVELIDVIGVLFESNIFENSVSLSFSRYMRGIGIHSWNSGYYLLPYGSDTIGNVFNGMDYGVRSFAFFGNNKPILIDQNEFNHNITGCYLGAETYASITRNTFNITTGTIELPDGFTGLYLDACTGYQIEENKFYANYFPIFHELTYSRSIGLVVNNSGPEDNFIYKNNFSKLGWATIAQNHNRDIEKHKGLQFKCNNFINNYMDIAVTWDGTPSPLNGIAFEQGSKADIVIAPAGNRFSKLGKTSTSDYNNEGEDFYYWMPYWNTVLNMPRLRPDSITYETIIRDFSPYDYDWTITSGCPSNLGIRTEGEIRTYISNNKSYEVTYTDSLNVLVDDGNTAGLNLDVSTSIPPETMILRDELLSASPYLSDTVMVNAAEKEDVLPNSIITEVLVANPQSAKAENVLNALDERNNPPSVNQMASINANDTVFGHKESLESKRYYYSGEKARAVYQLTNLFITDTTGLAIHDSIEQALSNINSLTSKYQQAFCRYNSSDSLGIVNLLDNIPYEFDLSSAEIDYHNYFIDYFAMLIDLLSQSKTVMEMDSLQKNVSYTIYNNTEGLLHAYTRNQLILIDNMVYSEPYILPDTSSNKSSLVSENTYEQLWESASYLKLYPNPANDYITIEYELEHGISSPVVEILTVTGFRVDAFRLYSNSGLKIVDLRNWNNGTYIVSLTNKGSLIQSSKFVKY